jgi:tellurite resistance protein TehA-like permease
MKNPLSPFFYAIIACIVTAISSLTKADELHLGIVAQQTYNLATSLIFTYFYLKKSKYAWLSLFLALPIIPIYLVARTLSQSQPNAFETINIITFSVWVFAIAIIVRVKDKYFEFVEHERKD